MPRARVVLICVVALGLSAGLSWGQAQPDLQNVRDLYAAAESAMARGEFAHAASQYRAAYELSKDAALLHKIAGAHDKAGDCAAALPYYERYLREGKPDESLTASVTERIAACTSNAQGAKGASDAASSAPGEGTTQAGAGSTSGSAQPAGAPAGSMTRASTAAGDEAASSHADAAGSDAPVTGERPPSFMAEQPSWHRDAGFVSAGIAVSLATAGAILAMSASSREDDVKNLITFRYPDGQPAEYTGTVRERYEELVDEGQRFQTLSRIALGAAGAAAITAAVFFVLDEPVARDDGAAMRAQVTPLGAPHTLGVSARWQF